MRQIVLDTETTGLKASLGDRIVEIGGVELINRQFTGNTYHRYINPERDIDVEVSNIHGHTRESLANEPRFEDIAVELLEYIKGAELIIHNAPFDIGFLNNEFKLTGHSEDEVQQHCTILDTLDMARKKHPGQKNNLDALCKRYHVDNTMRTLHGALLDAGLLAKVYLQMTGGQMTLLGEADNFSIQAGPINKINVCIKDASKLKFFKATAAELKEHDKWLLLLRNKSNNKVIWDEI